MRVGKLRMLSVFSGGVDGASIAAEWYGIKTVGFCEIDPKAREMLRKHWPGIPIFEDVKAVTRKSLVEGGVIESETGAGIDIICGGFPCQPHSVAGKRLGGSDERDLWPEYARIIRDIRPRWVVAENVPGLLSSDAGRFFGHVLGDLAAMGYDASWCVYGASDVGAPQRRHRLFVLAHAARW